MWGDPALYDSTLGILEEILERGAVAFEYDVVPGISSVSSLVARHRTGLNRVARPVQITTGRRLAEGFPEGVDDVVVMLDAHQAFRQYADQDIDIYWGAYIGTPDEILASGPIAEAAPLIERLRAEARELQGLDHGHVPAAAQPGRRLSRTDRPGGPSPHAWPVHRCDRDRVTVAEETPRNATAQPPVLDKAPPQRRLRHDHAGHAAPRPSTRRSSAPRCRRSCRIWAAASTCRGW